PRRSGDDPVAVWRFASSRAALRFIARPRPGGGGVVLVGFAGAPIRAPGGGGGGSWAGGGVSAEAGGGAARGAGRPAAARVVWRGESGGPDVARAAWGGEPVEGDGVGLDDGERRSVDRHGGNDPTTIRGGDGPIATGAVDQVDPDEVSDVARSRLGADVGQSA